MKKILTLFFCLFFITAALNAQSKNLYKYVDPFIGTTSEGHTFPGACVPFGLVQLSPDNDDHIWDWCSGYHTGDSSMMGFSHTHLSGTGGADLGDVLLMPYTGEWKIQPGPRNNPDEGYRSAYSIEGEKAEAGYYSVKLESYDILAELTATKHCGFHKYTFPKSDESNIILDLERGIGDKVTEAWLEVVGADCIRGMRRSSGWASDHYIFFYAKFSKPFAEYATVLDGKITMSEPNANGMNPKALLRFKTKAGESVLVKVGISAVSAENAEENLNAEITGWDFNKARMEAAEAWNKELSKAVIETKSEQQKTVFYTSMYHAFMVPYLFTDVNGDYRGMDGKIHKAEGFKYYTLFSLWDTFRAAHPLYSILAPEENNDFIKSLIAKYDEAGHLPIWELHSTDTWCMIGYHSVPVIADAYLKGYGNFDIQKAFKAMKAETDLDTSRFGYYSALKYYKEYGYVPRDKSGNSVSVTLEFAYDDWCIAQVAKKLGAMEDYEKYTKRALYYKNLFDQSTGFMRGKESSGEWRKDFDALNVSWLGQGDYTEGNAWQYTFFVPQDVNGLIDLYGGAKNFAGKLDQMFSQKTGEAFKGSIGEYAHGNEPSHHVAYLYAYAGEAYKTQAITHNILTTMYTDIRDGLCGNEDCGQMSAWYILSSMGFYPVNPADGNYVIGSPLFDKVTLNLTNGKTFTVKANNVSNDNYYIQSAKLNGKPYNKSYITHADITNGGELVFEMGNKPSQWGCAEGERPVSSISEE